MPTMEAVRYVPRGAARELFSTRSAEVLMSGPAGTGKSMAALYRLHMACLKYPGIRCLIVRKTAVSLSKTTLVTYAKKVAKHAIRQGIVRWYGGSGSEPAAYRYTNGSLICVGGMDKPESVLSSEYDLVFCDEATELTLTDWETLGSRLRNGVLPWQQQIAACNPSSPSHWMKLRADEGRTHILHSRHIDNPAYYNADGTLTEAGVTYMTRLDNLTGVRRLRLRDGVWAASEGIIFDQFDEAVHVVEPFEIPEDWDLLLSVDFGYVNPFVCQWWRVDPDDRMYLVREIYHTQRLVEDHARQMLDVMEEHPDEPESPYVVCDHDAEGRATLRKYLEYSPKAANKAVDLGIQNMQSRFVVQGDGKPRIFFFRDAVIERDRDLAESGRPTSTVEELTQYVWDASGTKGPKDAPLKTNDHGCDAARYACARIDRLKRV